MIYPDSLVVISKMIEKVLFSLRLEVAGTTMLGRHQVLAYKRVRKKNETYKRIVEKRCLDVF